MSRINWNRSKKTKDYEDEAKWKIMLRYSAYRDGQFWIGDRLVERWRQSANMKYPGEGLFLNSKTGRFEIWKEAKCIGSMKWRSPWQDLVTWAEANGFKTIN